MSTKKFHKVADMFPLLDGNEFAALVSSISENGLREAIWLHPEGSIIDGRNRYRACLECGVEPKFRTWSGEGSLVKFVVDMNLHRRHLNSSQRATAALDVLPMLEDEAAQRHKELAGREKQTVEIIPPFEDETGKARDKAAELFNTNPRYIQDAKKLQQEAPKLLDQVRTGKTTIPQAKKELVKRKRDNERKQLAESAQQIEPDKRWSVQLGDINTWQTDKRYDFIITDPPYPKEYLNLYETLAIKANEWLKDTGLLVTMCGQSYLNQIYEMMSKHLVYYWTAAYLLPGQPTPLRQRQVNCSWKPILIFAKSENYKGKIFGDVYTSDANDKDFHKWGQSTSGMLSLIKQICIPGQTIFDPFCGAGTTGIAALKHGCLFDAIDIEQENVDISIGRIAKL